MKPIIRQYIPIAEMIGKTFGDSCEVVLHDLEDPEHSVVYTVNNIVTGRAVGQSFNNLVPQVLMEEATGSELVANYYFNTPDGRLIKSSTALIKDFDNKVVGAICLNVDTTHITEGIARLSALLPDLERGRTKSKKLIDNANTHVSDVVDALIDRIIAGKDVAGMSRKEKVALMNVMEHRGVFLMKGAIDKVSAKTGISKVTIYSYIDKSKDV